MMVKWCTGQYKVDFLKGVGIKLKAEGCVVAYRIRKTVIEEGEQYGYLYIKVKEAADAND